MTFNVYMIFALPFIAMVFIAIAKVVLRRFGVNVKDVEDEETGFTNDITNPFSNDFNNIGK